MKIQHLHGNVYRGMASNDGVAVAGALLVTTPDMPAGWTFLVNEDRRSSGVRLITGDDIPSVVDGIHKDISKRLGRIEPVDVDLEKRSAAND